MPTLGKGPFSARKGFDGAPMYHDVLGESFAFYDLSMAKGTKKIDGTAADEWLILGSGGSKVDMGAGDDVVEGGAGADDLDGGEGGETNGDTLSYAGSDAGVTVSLRVGAPAPTGGDAAGDTITNFENLIGSEYNDVLSGDNVPGSVNFIFGLGGDDTINTGNGAVTVDGGDGNDTMFGGNSTQTFIGGEGEDTISTGRGADIVILTETTAMTDTIFIGTNSLQGGADTIIDFNTSDPAAGGDVIRTGLITGDLAAAVAGGYIDFASDGSGGTDILLDFDGGDDFEVGTTLEGIAFVDVGTSVALLADNFDFV